MAAPASEGETVDVTDLVAVLRRRWRFVAAGAAIGLVAAVGVLEFVAPVWTAEASVLVKDPTPLPSAITDMLKSSTGNAASTLLGVRTNVETEMGLLQSRELIGEVIDTLLLQVVARSPAGIAPTRIVRAVPARQPFRPLTVTVARVPNGLHVTAKHVDTVIALGGALHLPAGDLVFRDSLPLPLKLTLRDREDAITRASKRLMVETMTGDLIHVEWRGDDSLSAPAAANHLVARFLQWRKGADRSVNARRLEFVTMQIDSVERTLGAALERQRRFHEAAETVDPSVNAKAYLESLVRLREQREALVMEEAALAHLQAQLRTSEVRPREVAAYPTFLRSPGINELLGRIGQLDAQRVSMVAEGRRANDPALVAVIDASAELEKQLTPLTSTYASSIAQQRASLDAEIASVNARLAKLPGAVEGAFEHEQEVERLSRTSLALSAQQVELRLATVGEGGDARAVDEAHPQWRRSFPLPLPTLAFSVLAGLLLGAAAALLAPRPTAPRAS